MNLKQQVMIVALVATAGTLAAEGEVYKSVDSQGGVEFSDKPTPGAREVDVRPNVVEVTPVKPLPPTAPVSARPSDMAGGDAMPDEVLEDESSGYDGSNYYRNERRREIRRRIEQGPKPTQLPAHKGPGPARAAAHGGGGRGR